MDLVSTHLVALGYTDVVTELEPPEDDRTYLVEDIADARRVIDQLRESGK